MSTFAMNTVCTIIPALRYRDAPAAIDWLCSAFGFERNAIHPDGAGGIAHAQLTFGNGMIMLSTASDDEWGRRIAQPDQIGGRETQCACLVVSDPDAHYAMAMAAGAIIVDEIKDNDYGGRGYSARDPEGHMWWFGSYDPWKAET